MIIREANQDDCEKLDALLTKLIWYEVQYDSNLNHDYTVENNYSEKLDWPGHTAFVAEEDGEIVGFIYGFVFSVPGMFNKPIAIADALYVEEAYRNRGIATDLFRKFINFASEHNVCRVELKVMSENMRAIHIYEALGFSETRKYMALEMKAPDEI